MKRYISIVLLCGLLTGLLLTGCIGPLQPQTTTESTAGEDTAQTTLPAQTDAPTTAAPTTAAPTTTVVTTVPVTYNPEIVTGAPDASAGTYTGYMPLPIRSVTAPDPDNARGLSEKKVGFGSGLSQNGERPAASVNLQKTFDKYNALAIDLKTPGKVLYMTFDCGYENGYTASILDTLKQKTVPAAFFCTLSYIKQQPALTTRMIKEGHIVGNHSSTHPEFPDISRTKMANEVLDCDNYLREKFGYTAPYFRFPTGSYSDSALDLVQAVGFRSVFWSVAYADWDIQNQKGKQYAFDTVTSRLHPGAVILLHAVSSDNAQALGDIIDWARAQGYEFRAL